MDKQNITPSPLKPEIWIQKLVNPKEKQEQINTNNSLCIPKKSEKQFPSKSNIKLNRRRTSSQIAIKTPADVSSDAHLHVVTTTGLSYFNVVHRTLSVHLKWMFALEFDTRRSRVCRAALKRRALMSP